MRSHHLGRSSVGPHLRASWQLAWPTRCSCLFGRGHALHRCNRASRLPRVADEHFQPPSAGLLQATEHPSARTLSSSPSCCFTGSSSTSRRGSHSSRSGLARGERVRLSLSVHPEDSTVPALQPVKHLDHHVGASSSESTATSEKPGWTGANQQCCRSACVADLAVCRVVRQQLRVEAWRVFLHLRRARH